MAPDLVKAMFGVTSKATDPVEAPDALFPTDRAISTALQAGARGRSELLKTLGITQRSGNFRKAIDKRPREQPIEPTLPTMPNSRLQKYRLAAKGRQILIASTITTK